jgi:hypothetical protein
MTAEAKKRYAEVDKIRVEKFQHLYDLLCNKKYYAGSKYFFQSNFFPLFHDFILTEIG